MHSEVGQRIRGLRQKKGMRQEELARKVGLSPSALSNFEQGRRRTSLDWLRKISLALGVQVSDLIPESRTRKPLAESRFSPRTVLSMKIPTPGSKPRGARECAGWM